MNYLKEIKESLEKQYKDIDKNSERLSKELDLKWNTREMVLKLTR